jgi:hypothetical protein
MSNALILDTLFGIIALLFVPIGLRRGALREVFVTVGVLTGAQLSASWARPWGSNLADLFKLRVGLGEFIISMLFLIGTIILFGYGGAAAFHLPEPRLWGRLAGGALAVVNGALIVGYILRDIERFLTDPGTERTLEQSSIASTLLHQFGWVVLVAGLIMVIPMLISLLVGQREEKSFATPSAESTTWTEPAPSAMIRRPRMTWGTDEGKVEPVVRGFDSAIERYATDALSAQQTIPLAPVQVAAWPQDRAKPWSGASTEWVEVHSQTAGGSSAAGQELSPNGSRSRCTGCSELLSADELFCPSCGRSCVQ